MKIQKYYRGLACATMCMAVLGFAYPAHAEGGPKGEKAPHSKGGGPKGKMLEKFDTNKDGVISKGEFITEMEAKFADMDKDGSGDVSAEEMSAHQKAKRAEMKKMRDKMGGKHGKGHEGHSPPHGDDMPPPPAE